MTCPCGTPDNSNGWHACPDIATAAPAPRTIPNAYARRIADPTGAGLTATFTSPHGLIGFAAIQHGRTEAGQWIVTDLASDCQRIVPADYSRKVAAR